MTEIGKNIYVIEGSTNIGVIIEEKDTKFEVILIDSGGSELDGEKVISILDDFFSDKQKKYELRSIFNTHSHADHCGGNAILKNKYNCDIYIPIEEKGSVENNLLQSSFIWGGYPPKELRTVYYQVQYAEVTGTYSESTVIKLNNNRTMSFISLPGHYFNNMAIIITDANCKKLIFSGDAIFTRLELGKYWIPFMINPTKFQESLDKFLSIKDIGLVVPGHGTYIGEELEQVIELNKIAVLSTKTCILDLLKTKSCSTEEIIQNVANKNEITMKFGQFVLIGSTIRSYLSAMYDEGLIKHKMENNMLYWYSL